MHFFQQKKNQSSEFKKVKWDFSPLGLWSSDAQLQLQTMHRPTSVPKEFATTVGNWSWSNLYASVLWSVSVCLQDEPKRAKRLSNRWGKRCICPLHKSSSQRTQPTICCVSVHVLTRWCLSLPGHNLPVKLSQTRLGFEWQPHLQYCWWLDWGNEYTGNYFLKDK